jgi:hypothetical protein
MSVYETASRKRQRPGCGSEAFPSRLCSRLAMIMICLAMIGCRENAPEPPAAAPPGSPDAKALAALDHFNPMYKVDAAGRVTHLRLPWQHLPSPALAEIAQLTELQFLELSWSTLNDGGLAQLKDLQHLQTMSLVGTAITDQGLDHLEKLPSLQRVWVSKNRLSEQAIENLRKARPDLAVHLL